MPATLLSARFSFALLCSFALAFFNSPFFVFEPFALASLLLCLTSLIGSTTSFVLTPFAFLTLASLLLFSSSSFAPTSLCFLPRALLIYSPFFPFAPFTLLCFFASAAYFGIAPRLFSLSLPFLTLEFATLLFLPYSCRFRFSRTHQKIVLVVFSPEFGIAQDEMTDPHQTHKRRRCWVTGEIGVFLDGLLAVDVRAIDFVKSRVGRYTQHVI